MAYPGRTRFEARTAIFAAGLTLLVGGTVGLGCGPSFQAVHEGEARFEHCYALEESSSTALERKADCWNDWVRHYTYGQTRDRVSYAAQRYRALSRVPDLPTDEAMMSAAPGEGVTGSSITAPAPTSAFAPPPKTLEDRDAGAASTNANPNTAPVPSTSGPTVRAVDAGALAARPPAAACIENCEADWAKCRAACSGKGCDGCEKPFKVCLGRCAK